MKYAVIGAGGMGIQYGVLLQEFAHKDVDFIDTWKPNVEKIREQGGAYVSQDGEDRHLVPINVYYPEEYTGQPDVWIVFLKQMQLDGVLKRCAHLFNDKQVVFSAMNGYGHFEKLNEYFVKDRIYGGTALIGAYVYGPGDFNFTGGARATGEVEVARPVHVGADQRGAAVDAVFDEVFVELFEMPVAVHGGEHDLLVVEQVGAALEHAVELHLLQEYDPHIRLAGVFLRIVHVDRHQVAVFAVLGHVGTTLFADLLDVRLPGVDEIDVLVREFLQQHAVLDAHAASANHRILHVPCLLSPVVFVVFKRIPTRYRETSLSMPAWLYALLMEGANRNNSFL